MDIHTPLFEGPQIVLGPIDHDHDPEVESRWTHDPEYLRLLGQAPARPLSPAQVKKRYEDVEKSIGEGKNLFYFTIRLREAVPGAPLASALTGERLLGFVLLNRVEWSNGCSWIQMGIGDPQDRGKGYGGEALRLLLHYAFAELNLYRITVEVPEYNEPARRLFAKAGFVEEVRRREAIHRAGRRWDHLMLGLLRSDWV